MKKINLWKDKVFSLSKSYQQMINLFEKSILPIISINMLIPLFRYKKYKDRSKGERPLLSILSMLEKKRVAVNSIHL